MEKKLKKAQRQLSKKKKGSVKWNKARKKVAKTYNGFQLRELHRDNGK